MEALNVNKEASLQVKHIRYLRYLLDNDSQFVFGYYSDFFFCYLG